MKVQATLAGREATYMISQENVLESELTCTFDSLRSSGVFEHDAELGKVGRELLQVGEEELLGVQDGDVLLLNNQSRRNFQSMSHLRGVARHLAVQIQHHVRLLHGLEDGIVHAIVLNAARGIGGHSSGI